MRIINALTVVFVIIALVAFFNFLYYPYSELSSMQGKTTHAVNCLYAMIASVIGLAVTAYIASRN